MKTDRQAEIRARLEAAKPDAEEWCADRQQDPEPFDAGHGKWWVLMDDGDGIAEVVGHCAFGIGAEPLARLYASAAADLAWCLDRIAALEARATAAEDALGFYADPANYEQREAIVVDDEDDIDDVFAILDDDGEIGDPFDALLRFSPGRRARAYFAARTATQGDR